MNRLPGGVSSGACYAPARWPRPRLLNYLTWRVLTNLPSANDMANGMFVALSEIKRTKSQIKRLNLETKQQVENTPSRLATNRKLQTKMSECALAQAEVSQQQEILQTIIDHLPVLVSFIDQRGQIQLVNREWERTIGWSLEEIRKQQLDIFAECYPDPQYRQQVMDFIANSNGEWADFKTKVRDGRIIDLTWAVVHISDGTLIGIGQDRTEWKRRDEDLYSITAAMENAVVGISRLDARGNYVSVNCAYASALGYTSTQMRGLSREATIYPADREKMHEAYQQMLAHGRAEVEVRGLRQDGSVFYKQVVLVKTQSSQGEFLGHHCFMKDISEKKAAEEEIYRDREFLQAVLESIEEGIVACDANGVLSLFNRSSRENLGRDMEPLPVSEWPQFYQLYYPGGKELYSPNDLPLIRALHGETVRGAEVVTKTPAGKERIQLCNAAHTP